VQKPKVSESPKSPMPPSTAGRFVGLVAVGKERYQVHVLEMVGDVIEKREVYEAGKDDIVNGLPVPGLSLASAWYSFQQAAGKSVKDNASSLWQRLVKS